jgi:hypothetical protein
VKSSYGLGISTSAPVRRSYRLKSTAQPRLCFEPFRGSATKDRLSPGVISQKSLVTDHGR